MRYVRWLSWVILSWEKNFKMRLFISHFKISIAWDQTHSFLADYLPCYWHKTSVQIFSRLKQTQFDCLTPWNGATNSLVNTYCRLCMFLPFGWRAIWAERHSVPSSPQRTRTSGCHAPSHLRSDRSADTSCSHTCWCRRLKGKGGRGTSASVMRLLQKISKQVDLAFSNRAWPATRVGMGLWIFSLIGSSGLKVKSWVCVSICSTGWVDLNIPSVIF